jgi:quinol monooxygenase YgiN
VTDQLAVFARITPKPEHLNAARQAILGIVPVTRSEPGCRMFTLHDDRDDSGHLYLYEVWDSEAAFAAHHDQPYTKAVFTSYIEWLAKPVDITMLRCVG